MPFSFRRKCFYSPFLKLVVLGKIPPCAPNALNSDWRRGVHLAPPLDALLGYFAGFRYRGQRIQGLQFHHSPSTIRISTAIRSNASFLFPRRSPLNMAAANSCSSHSAFWYFSASDISSGHVCFCLAWAMCSWMSWSVLNWIILSPFTISTPQPGALHQPSAQLRNARAKQR